MIAPAAAALDLEALRAIDPADYGQLHFELHPACRLFSSEYPVLDIWHANQPGAGPIERINLANGATRALLHRPAQVVQFHLLSVAHAALLEAFGRDLPLGEALDAAHNVDPAFELGAPLRHFVALGVLTQATLKGRSAACDSERKRTLKGRCDLEPRP